MFQEIGPHVFHNEFREMLPGEGDPLLVLDGNQILLKFHKSGSISLPTVGEIRQLSEAAGKEAFYLFSIDEQPFFLTLREIPEKALRQGERFRTEGEGFGEQKAGQIGHEGESSYSYEQLNRVREMEDRALLFGAAVAAQLGQWYSLHQYCGKCGVKTVRSKTERAIQCPECGHLYYPRISPVVIIAITDGDQILLTRYKNAPYRRHALVAGFVEIGETLEDAIRREVREEVGLSVKNIRYCESQPWPFSSSLIAGFFADVDGDRTVHLNTDGGEELAEGVWVSREDLVLEDPNFSLTWDMVRKFKMHEEPV